MDILIRDHFGAIMNILGIFVIIAILIIFYILTHLSKYDKETLKQMFLYAGLFFCGTVILGLLFYIISITA